MEKKCAWCGKELPKFCLWRGFHIKCYQYLLENSNPHTKKGNFKIKS